MRAVATKLEWIDSVSSSTFRWCAMSALKRSILIERPRARRYPLAASIEMVEMESDTELRAQTTDISVFGCRVNVAPPWVPGSKLRLRIFHRGAVLTASGAVANVRLKGGMGVVFTQIEEKQQEILEKWLTELHDTHERVSAKR
jgi:hypothetical protein